MRMRVYGTIPQEQLMQLQRALQRWENEGGAGLRDMQASIVKAQRAYDSNPCGIHRPRWSSPRTPQRDGSDG